MTSVLHVQLRHRATRMIHTATRGRQQQLESTQQFHLTNVTTVIKLVVVEKRKGRLFCSSSHSKHEDLKKIKIKTIDKERESIHKSTTTHAPIATGSSSSISSSSIGAASSASHNFTDSTAGKNAMFATKLGAAANLGLAVSKGSLGLSISSTGLVADAASSLGDLLSDAVVYYSVTEARKRATPDRPWGSGKIEPLGALSVGTLLLLTGCGIGASALFAAIDAAVLLDLIPVSIVNSMKTGEYLSVLSECYSSLRDSMGEQFADALPSSIRDAATLQHSSSSSGSGATDASVHLWERYAALGVSGLSIVAKELLFRYTLKAGIEAHSDAVIANAWQHRADVSTSLAVFVGLVGGMGGYPILDPIAGLVVSGLIFRQGAITIKDALTDLSDAPAGLKETEKLRVTCLRVNGVKAVQEIKARKSGPYLYVEVMIAVDGYISASAAHRIGELTRLELLKHHSPRVANVVVDVNPLETAGLGESYPHWARDHDFLKKEIEKAASGIKEVLSVSEVQIYYKDNGEISSKLDIVLPSSLTVKEAHAIAVRVRAMIEAALPGMRDIDVDLELDETDQRPKEGSS